MDGSLRKRLEQAKNLLAEGKMEESDAIILQLEIATANWSTTDLTQNQDPTASQKPSTEKQAAAGSEPSDAHSNATDLVAVVDQSAVNGSNHLSNVLHNANRHAIPAAPPSLSGLNLL